jgi:heterodisulfide reductase subunit B
MTYAYYPGCSAAGTGKPFEESLVAVLERLDVDLEELDDWNCCGASAAHSIDVGRSVALVARNLAIAEATKPDDGPVDLLTPCTGCFRAMLSAQGTLERQGAVAERVDHALDTIGLRYDRRVRVRHVVDLLAFEIGLDRVKEAVVAPLEGLRVASYYGCLLVRPDAPFDDQREPTSMDDVMRAVGAEPVDWALKTRCCGGSCYGADPFSGTTPQGSLALSYAILREAKRQGADVIATACPLCQFNLEAFQGQMNKEFGSDLDITVGYLTQFVGLALGIDERTLGIKRMLHWRLPDKELVSVAAATAAEKEGGDDGGA